MEMAACPHCGSSDVTYHNGWKFGDRNRDPANNRSPAICCGGCGTGFGIGVLFDGISDDDAERMTVDAWNRRPPAWQPIETAPKDGTLDVPDTDTTRCPGCGGPATNGTDRCVPPNAYYCDRCANAQADAPENAQDETV